ncbi:hypothetical protein ABZP36_018754 [Zizania latifolia]
MEERKFVATELATGIVISIGDVKFYLHKFPLLSKSSCLQRLVAASNEESNDELDISDIPGGPSAFEICAKFCYGMIVTQCYLEMFETIDKGNLLYKIDVFLASSIFRTWKDSIVVLQSSRSLLPWSENSKVINHCIDSIASKALIDPSEKLPPENGHDSHWNGVRKQVIVPKDWWVEDLCDLEMDLYKQVITTIKAKGRTLAIVIGEALRTYAYRRLLGSLDNAASNGVDCTKHHVALEIIIFLLPTEKGSVSCGFLLELLRAACLLEAGESCRDMLIKRIVTQLDGASVSDLLVPANTSENSLYNVDLIIAIMEEFVSQHSDNGKIYFQDDDEMVEVENHISVSSTSKLAVANLIDGYLAEIAKDSNLPLSKFIALAEMVSPASRKMHDGLYRAIDMYLMEHPSLSKSEKKVLCRLMDCKKLSQEACVHAVQNERLPLRVVVQVLFFEQIRASVPSWRRDAAAELPSAVHSLLPRENGNSYGSSRSAATTTTTEEDCTGVPTSSDVNSFRSMRLADNSGGSERSSGSSDINNKSSSKSKGLHMPKKILSKLWSGKTNAGENSSSDTSESPGSVNHEDVKSTQSRNTRHSLS